MLHHREFGVHCPKWVIRVRVDRGKAVAHVRSSPKADENRARSEPPLCAKRRHSAPQQTAGYSMSWSARRRKDSEIVSPSVLAVFRLMTSATLVGCWTARSEGLVPLRILST
jgi:hypothetical protein